MIRGFTQRQYHQLQRTFARSMSAIVSREIIERPLSNDGLSLQVHKPTSSPARFPLVAHAEPTTKPSHLPRLASPGDLTRYNIEYRRWIDRHRYPTELEETARLRGGQKVLLRPIRPDDEPLHHELFGHFAPEDMRFRFFGMIKLPLPHSEMVRYTQIDYEREMAFIAVEQGEGRRGGGHRKAGDEIGTQGKELGVVRAVGCDPWNKRAEFAIIVRTDTKKLGLGRILLEKMIRYCRGKGYKFLVGEVLANNIPMLTLARALGFQGCRSAADPCVVEVTLKL